MPFSRAHACAFWENSAFNIYVILQGKTMVGFKNNGFRDELEKYAGICNSIQIKTIMRLLCFSIPRKHPPERMDTMAVECK